MKRRVVQRQRLPTALLLAVLAYLAVALMRPQDVVPVLEFLKPGLISSLAVLALWLSSRSFSHMRDPLVKWQFALLFVLLIGVTVAVNHRFWFDTVLSYLIYIVCLTLGLVAVGRFRTGRDAILKSLLLFYLFQTIWALFHNGVGTGHYFHDENDAAAAMIVGGSLAYAIWRYSQPSLWSRIALVATALSCVGIVVTMSRGGFVGFVAAVLAVLFVSKRLLKGLILVLVFVAASYPLIPADYKSDIQSISDPTDSTRRDRIYSWNRAVDLFVKSPLIGVGAGNYPWRVTEVELTERAIVERGGKRLLGGRVSHSLYFTLLPENGLLGVVAYITLVIIVFRRAWDIVRRSAKESIDPSLLVVAHFIVVGLIGYSVAAIFISVLWYPHFWLMVGLAILLSPKASMDLDGVISWRSTK